MLTALIDLSLKNRFLVIALFGLMAIGGIYSATQIPIDAVPDMTNTQVVVITEAPGLSPVEVEQYVTYPVEETMRGLPQVLEARSVSKFGISSLTIVFQEGTDIYGARQLVNERLTQAQARLGGINATPEMTPIASAVGEILQFEVRWVPIPGYRERKPMELRTLLEWEIAPQLRQVKGVTEINSHGGFYKSFEVQLDPNRMEQEHVGLDEVLDALSHNNASAGGGYIVHQGEQRFIRGEAMLRNAEDIGNVVVRAKGAALPILVKDVATVEIAPLVRQGAVTRDGRGEAVTGMVMMLLGENSRTVVQRAKEKLKEVQATLPPDVKLEIIYDRSDLIGRTLHTVVQNLLEGGVLVVVVLLVLLGSWRAGLVVAVAIPLSMLFATNVMLATGVSASLMSLGAIDFGLVVDSSVIMIENCMRRIAHNSAGKSHLEVVREAAVEVREPTMFGELIIAVVYLPILTLQGTEGKLFTPMALTVLFALGGSLLLSLTLMPVLAYVALPWRMQEREPWLLRVVKGVYRPLVERVLEFPLLAALVAVALLLISVPIGLRLERQFMPQLDEGDILIEANRLPSATLEDAEKMSKEVEELLLQFPEVKTVFCKTGRPEIANDLMGVQQTDIWVMLHPQEDWPAGKTKEELRNEMSEALNKQVGGTVFVFTQPIEMRVNELVAGVKAEVAVLLRGDDLKVLDKKAREIERVLKSLEGAKDVKAEHPSNASTVTILARQSQLARYGIEAQALLDTVSAAGGREVGQVFEGRRRFPILVRFPPLWRESEVRLKQLPVNTPGGHLVPLGELADVVVAETPPSVEHEGGRRRTTVQCNVEGSDKVGFVRRARQAVAEQVKLPTGYEIRWGGDFENFQSASRRLSIITPIVLLIIAMLLYTSLKSARLAVLIFLAVPVAASGGVIALALRDMPFSISAGVGFIALFGVAVLNGLVWVSGAENLRKEGADSREAAKETALIRIRPILMTALVASLGFLPMALSTTAGAEIQRPLATVVIGGLITSTLLTAFVIPAIYPWFAPVRH
jgi:cobalt-zinc-cadmium resistance protein CzcA